MMSLPMPELSPAVATEEHMARRSSWHQVKGCWVRSLGERGMRVRLFQMRRDGSFYRDVWVPGRGKDRRCLGTRDRTEAERLGRQLLAALLEPSRIIHAPSVL